MMPWLPEEFRYTVSRAVCKERKTAERLLVAGDVTTFVRHNWRLLTDMTASVRHDQREKPNNLKLAQQKKVLIHNQLADKTKVRLPTFSHNLHLADHHISLIFKNIHQITACRLFESIQFCVVTFLVTHRIFCGPTAIPDNSCITERILSVKLRLLADKLYFPDLG